MTVQDLIADGGFQVVNRGRGFKRTITKPFCCDLLSFAMSKAPEGCAWVTVMNNVNTLAVASLADAACVIMAEGAALDEATKKKADLEGITVLHTDRPIFETALAIHEKLQAEGHENH